MTQAEVRINKVRVSDSKHWSVQVMLPGLHVIAETRTWDEAWTVARRYTEPLLGHTVPFGARVQAAKALSPLEGVVAAVESEKPYTADEWQRRAEGWRRIACELAAGVRKPYGVPKCGALRLREEHADIDWGVPGDESQTIWTNRVNFPGMPGGKDG